MTCGRIGAGIALQDWRAEDDSAALLSSRRGLMRQCCAFLGQKKHRPTAQAGRDLSPACGAALDDQSAEQKMQIYFEFMAGRRRFSESKCNNMFSLTVA